MTSYETVFITLPNLTEEDEQATVDTLARIVTQGGGTLITSDRMGRRRLAYPIRKFDDGIYTRFLYDSDKDVPKELERRIGLSDNVLRCLTVVLEKDWAVAAKEQAKQDAQRKIEAVAEAERQAAEAERAAQEAAVAAAAAAEAAAESGVEAGTEAEPEAETEARTDGGAEATAPPVADEPAAETAQAAAAAPEDSGNETQNEVPKKDDTE